MTRCARIKELSSSSTVAEIQGMSELCRDIVVDFWAAIVIEHVLEPIDRVAEPCDGATGVLGQLAQEIADALGDARAGHELVFLRNFRKGRLVDGGERGLNERGLDGPLGLGLVDLVADGLVPRTIGHHTLGRGEVKDAFPVPDRDRRELGEDVHRGVPEPEPFREFVDLVLPFRPVLLQ